MHVRPTDPNGPSRSAFSFHGKGLTEAACLLIPEGENYLVGYLDRKKVRGAGLGMYVIWACLGARLEEKRVETGKGKGG